MFSVLLASLAYAGNILIDKIVLSRRKVAISDYIPLLFVFIFFCTLLTLPWLGGINWALAASRTYGFYFILMILLAIMSNIFYYQGLKKEKLLEFELISMLTPLFIVLMAAVFFPEEFNLPVMIAALVGTLALFLSHLRKHHLDFGKYEIHLLLAVILMAMEVMVQQELLAVYSPATLYALRTGTLALFFTIYYKPNIKTIADFDFRMVFLAAALASIYFILRLYGFQIIGITFTTLILLISPILVAWISARANNEHIQRRSIIAFIVILLSVAVAAVLQRI